MMTSMRLSVTAAMTLAALAVDARADFLIYNLGTKGQRQGTGTRGGPAGNLRLSGAGRPRGGDVNAVAGTGTGREMILYGTVSIDRVGISFANPDLKAEAADDKLLFQPNQVEVMKAPMLKAEFIRAMSAAGKDPEAVMQAAIWALKKGLPGDFYAGIDKVLTLDPKNEIALRIRELKKQIELPLPDDPATEKTLRSIVNQPKMQIETGHHFILLHDTDDKPESGHHLSRAKERLKLLEQVYERFVLLFHTYGVQLDLPREKMMVVMFKELTDFEEVEKKLNRQVAGAAGLWDPIRNVSYFYDDSTTEESKFLKAEQKELDKVGDRAKTRIWRDAETVRQIHINETLLNLDRLYCDMAAVGREVSLQVAANTGLLPRRVEIPGWVQAGLATYFEAPVDGAWAGIGAVNDARLSSYKALENDRVHSNVDFVVGDEIAGFGTSPGTKEHANAQAWALTHFLFETHAADLVAFYRILSDMPPDVPLSPELLQHSFSRQFSSDHKLLDAEWHSFMRSLKTDFQRLEEHADNKK